MNKIKTLDELRAEKKRLKTMMELSKREFAHSIGVMRTDLGKVAKQGAAVVAGVAGTAYLGKKALSGGEEKIVRMKQSAFPIKEYLPILLNLVNTYILKKNNNTNLVDLITSFFNENNQPQATNNSTARGNNSSAPSNAKINKKEPQTV